MTTPRSPSIVPASAIFACRSARPRNAKTPGLKLVDLRPPFGIAWFRLFYCLG
jgi:hypothetical protein